MGSKKLLRVDIYQSRRSFSNFVIVSILIILGITVLYLYFLGYIIYPVFYIYTYNLLDYVLVKYAVFCISFIVHICNYVFILKIILVYVMIFDSEL